MSILLMRPKEEHCLKTHRIDYRHRRDYVTPILNSYSCFARLTLHHGWDQGRDIVSDVQRLDLLNAKRVLLDSVECTVPADWKRFLEDPRHVYWAVFPAQY